MQKLALGMSPLVWAGVIARGGRYYRVIDTATEKTYFTDRSEAQKRGAIILKDANTGSTVTLQNWEVTAIEKEEYRANNK